MAVSLATLITAETRAAIYAKGLALATTLGLPVTSWSAGDSTRALYHYLSEILETLETIVVGYIKSGFLDLCAADSTLYDRLVILADQVYGYTATEATYATCTVRLTNSGGGIYDIAAGDLTFKATLTGATYHNTSAGVLASGAVAMSGAPNLTFVNVGATGDTITRSAGSFITDGFLPGMTITVAGSVSNNVTGVVAGVSALVLTMGTTALVAEGPVGGCTVTAASTLDVDVEADEPGTDSSASVGDIVEMVTTLLGVACTNTTAAVGVDAESAASIVTGCRAKLGALSPSGARDAYVYVATNQALTTAANVTRARASDDSTTGAVSVYLASATGAASAGDVALVTTAITTYATPLCITPTVASATAVPVPVTYSLWLYDSVGVVAADIELAVAAALRTVFAARPIGGDVLVPPNGNLYKSMIESTIRNVYPDHAFRVTVAAPAGDTVLTPSQVATLGAITPTITITAAP